MFECVWKRERKVSVECLYVSVFLNASVCLCVNVSVCVKERASKRKGVFKFISFLVTTSCVRKKVVK